MKFCDKCKREVSINESYCTHCGTKLLTNENNKKEKSNSIISIISLILFCVAIVGILGGMLIVSNSSNAGGIMLYAMGIGPIVLIAWGVSLVLAVIAIVTYIKELKKSKSIKNIRKIFTIINVIQIVLTIIAIILCFCSINGLNKEEEQYVSKLENQASENAINYINDKYGFAANLLSAQVERSDSGPIIDPSPEPTGKVFVELKYDNKKFEVYISGESETTDGYDNYQYNQIVTDVLKLIETKVNIKSRDNSIYFGINKGNGLIKEKYDNNLSDIIQNNNFRMLLSYVNQSNLEYVKTNNLLDEFDNSKIILINYHSVSAYTDSINLSYNVSGTGGEEQEFYDNAPNIESVYMLENNEENYYEFNLKELNGIYYYDTSQSEKEIISNVNLSKTTISDASNWIGHGASENVRKILDAYLVSGDYNRLYVYIPRDMIDDYQVKNIDVGINCVNKNGNFKTSKGKIVGDYFVSSLYLSDCDKNHDTKFTLLYSTYEK